METIIRNPYVRLRDCRNVADIDAILSDIGFSSEDTGKRLSFLYYFMGIEQVFSANELTLTEKYDVAKEELVSQLWK